MLLTKIELVMNITEEFQDEILGFSKSAIYQIEVLGEISKELAGRIPGMSTAYEEKKKGMVSILTGRLSDQSALSGVLNSLYDMHITVLSVKMLKREKN